MLWEGALGHRYGSCIVTGDEKLLAFDKGTLVLAEAGGDAYRELARVEGIVPATCYPHLALADGLIACKDYDGNLVVLAVDGQGGE
jgi:hypothetical protein